MAHTCNILKAMDHILIRHPNSETAILSWSALDTSFALK
jgi:hypothetical protein